MTSSQNEGPAPRTPATEDARQRVRDQINQLNRAQDGRVGWQGPTDDPADFDYLYVRDLILVRSEDADLLTTAVERRSDLFNGPGLLEESALTGLQRMTLPPGRAESVRSIENALRELETEPGLEGRLSPEHWIHVTGNGVCCPATEPEETGLNGPWPPVSTDPVAGAGVRVSVVDTGWDPEAAARPESWWLSGVTGDDEMVDAAYLHEYAGHGTFVAGVVRCMAPAAQVRVEGFLLQGGAVEETRIVQQLIEALDFDPAVINLSAGCRTREDRPLISFEMFYDHYLSKRDTVLVASAGNDSTDAPFYPAAFDWAVGVGSLDRSGQMSSFSNYGRYVDVWALGRNVVNAYPDGHYSCFETPNVHDVRVFDNGLCRWSGTSFSSPIVAGLIAARMTAANETPAQARDAVLRDAVTRTDPHGRGNYQALLPPYTP